MKTRYVAGYRTLYFESGRIAVIPEDDYEDLYDSLREQSSSNPSPGDGANVILASSSWITKHPDDPTAQRTWRVEIPGSWLRGVYVTSMGPVVPMIQLSGAAQYTPDQADQVAAALQAAAADARLRFHTPDG